MAMSRDEFLKQLEESAILDSGSLNTIRDITSADAMPKDADGLARELVRQRKLTEFQAEQARRGNASSLILGNYLLMEEIGHGGMGQVFKAHHRRMKRVVAVKVLPAAMAKDAAAIARFEREVETLAKISHPNIVAAYDADCASGVHFLVMEFVEGSDLFALVRKNGPLAVEKASNYIVQAARGLEAAHKNGIVHRDIKPANLLLDISGTVKVLDMGLARLGADGDSPRPPDLTNTDTIMGTADYIAPEQAMNTKNADQRADIYSLGISLYFLLTGKPPYSGETAMERILAHRDQPIPSLRSDCPDVPDQLEVIFKKMVAKSVTDRYQTMGDVIADLELCGTLKGPTVAIPTPANSVDPKQAKLQQVPASQSRPPVSSQTLNPGPKPKNNRKLRLIGAAGLGVALLVVIVVSLKPQTDKPIVNLNQPDATLRGKQPEPVKAKSVIVSSPPVTDGGKEPLFFQTPDYEPWAKEVAAMPAEKQVEAISKKLMVLNPGFNGAIEHQTENGEVTFLKFETDDVTDISPVRCLPGLRRLECFGNYVANVGAHGKLRDLSPLEGMELNRLHLGANGQLSDLSPLSGMPLKSLDISFTAVEDITPLTGLKLHDLDVMHSPVKDLTPLRGMELSSFNCDETSVQDLLPLQGMPLQNLHFSNSKVSDLSPLVGMPLTRLSANNTPVSDLSILRKMQLNELGLENTMVSDLSPLRGMQLEKLFVDNTHVSDLSPLMGMPLSELCIQNTLASDLSPLSGMKLKVLRCGTTTITDLTPLRGMEIDVLDCYRTPVNDLSPLRGIRLKQLRFTPKNITQALNVVRQMDSLVTIGTNWENKNMYSADEFWRRFDAGEFGKPGIQPLTDVNSPAFQKWVDEVSAAPAKQQVEAFTIKLKELNPYFEDVIDTKIEDGCITEISFCTDNVFDISPVQILKKLKRLTCCGSAWGMGQLSNLTPLKGLSLAKLNFCYTNVSDLSPLQGMPLDELIFYYTPVSDLSPLKEMPLSLLDFGRTRVSDLAPLTGMHLLQLKFSETPVSDISPLRGIGLNRISLTPRTISNGIDLIRQMKSLAVISVNNVDYSPSEFWMKYDAVEFGKPVISDSK